MARTGGPSRVGDGLDQLALDEREQVSDQLLGLSDVVQRGGCASFRGRREQVQWPGGTAVRWCDVAGREVGVTVAHKVSVDLRWLA